MNPNDQKTLRKTLNLFFLIFIATGGLVSGLASAFYRSEINSFLSEIKNQETLTVTLQEKIIGKQFDSIISDLFFLSRQNELIAFLDTGDFDYVSLIESEYFEISQHTKTYDQLRYLDKTGQEIIRVNYNKGNVRAVPEDALQDKSNRYYFSDAIVINEGEVFVSPLDLNIENGQIEKPLKPMIRFATPVFDTEKNKSGIVLINYLANTLLEDISTAGELSIGSIMLINSEGYWLQNQMNRKFEWGFMFAEHQQQTFPIHYPEEWTMIENTKAGQLETENGLFTYKTVFPLEKTVAAPSEKYFWVVVSHVSPGVIKDNKRKILFELFIFGAGVFIIIALGSWFTALSITRNRLHKIELVEMATRDTLTSLPNRRMCFERLSSALDHAKRFNRKLGILYIDLDGFKEINDTKGHSAGDELLIKVSEILTSISRSSDIVARLGGDEFVCILSEIESAESAVYAGRKSIDALNVPIDLSSGRVFIGASVGVSIFPDHDTDPEGLLTKADKAMYEAKAKGKNNCTIYTESM